MARKYGNTQRTSHFLCLHCMRINELGTGIQRGGFQREKYHIKDLSCYNPECHGMITKNMEIKYNECMEDIYNKAMKVRQKYY